MWSTVWTQVDSRQEDDVSTAKRLRKRLEVEPRLYEAIRVYGEARAMSVSVALHELVIQGLEHKGLSLATVLEHSVGPQRRDGRV
jgi:hypothetical protein